MAVSKTADVGSNPACPGACFVTLAWFFFCALYILQYHMRLPRVKYHFKFLIKSEWSGSLLKLNKFAPVLNQLAIEDSSKLDETINYFYENQNWPNAEPLTLFGSLSLLVWRRQAPYSLFFLRPATLDSLLKIWSDENDRGVVKTNSFCLDLLAQRNGLLVDTRRLSLLANLKDLY
jgi:hypothetical protein